METEKVKVSQIDHEKFRLFLQQEYERKRTQNSSYSLRAFARKLDIHASCLSAILRGIRPLTDKLIIRFISKIDLSPSDYKQLKRTTKDKNSSATNTLTLDTFAIISQWYHYAILELPRLEDFRADPAWIANTLEISITEVQNAQERLERVGLLEVRDGKWIVLEKETQIFANEFTNVAMKRLQSTILGLSSKSIDDVPIEKRYHGTHTMGVDPERITEAKERIREFRKEFSNEFGTNEKTTDIYQLHIGYFPLTNFYKENKK